jgi:hypothetical protein
MCIVGKNPSYGYGAFDNIGEAALLIFTVITLEVTCCCTTVDCDTTRPLPATQQRDRL